MIVARREFLACAAAAVSGLQPLASLASQKSAKPLKLGLVTYNWGKGWDLPTLIRNCAATGFSGVELRSTHKHGVEITLDSAQRAAVRDQFADSGVEVVGLGSAV